VTRPSHLLILAAAFVAVSSCSGSAQEQAQMSRYDALVMVKDEVSTALTRGRGAQLQEMQVDLHVVVGRFNPGRCECPAFEMLLGGVWTRVFLTWVEAAPNAEDRIGELETEATRAIEEGTLPLYLFTSRLTSERRTASNDLEYGVMVVSRVDDVGARSVSSAIELDAAGLPNAAPDRQPDDDDSEGDEDDNPDDTPEQPDEPDGTTAGVPNSEEVP
jgi:hypothetical protein